MTAPNPPTPDDASTPHSEDALIEAASSDAPPPDIDLSNEALFENEPPRAPAAPETQAVEEPRTDRPAGPVFRASLTDAIWLLWRRASGNPVEELGCRQCGYPARQLTKRVCPECGADFMRNGLLNPSDTRLGLVTIALVWTLALLAAGIATRVKFSQFVLPMTFHRFVSLEFVERQPGPEPHRLTLFGEFNSDPRWPNEKTALDDSITNMVVYLAPKESSPVACDLDLVHSTYAFRDGGRPLFSGYPSTGKLDDDAIATWILFSGIEAHRNELNDQAAMTIAMIGLLKQNSAVARQNSPTGYGVFDTPIIRQIYAERSDSQIAPQYIPLVFLAWAALWLLGISTLMWFTRNRPAKPLTQPQRE